MRLGDLDALKDEMSKVFFNDNDDMIKIEKLIDNAPTIEQEVYMTGENYDLYIEGYKQAQKDFRSQGEWSITDETDEFYGRVYKCTHCGKEMLACGCRNFCTWCGAKMGNR